MFGLVVNRCRRTLLARLWFSFCFCSACPCQWQSKTAHFWQLKTAHIEGGVAGWFPCRRAAGILERAHEVAGFASRSVAVGVGLPLHGAPQFLVLAHSVAVAADVDDVAVVQQPVDEGGEGLLHVRVCVPRAPQ